MRKRAVSLALCAALAGPAFAAEAPVPSDPALKAMDARIRALEADAQKLREQAAQALAEASAAREELEKMKAQQVAAPITASSSPTAADSGAK